MKISSCTRTLLGPVKPTGQTGRLLPNRLHRQRPVRPPGATGQTGWYSLLPILVVNICPPVLWQSLRAKEHSSGPKLSKGEVTNTLAIFCAKGDKNYRPCLAFLQVDETICFGLQTFFMATGFVGSTSTHCSIFSWLRKRWRNNYLDVGENPIAH